MIKPQFKDFTKQYRYFVSYCYKNNGFYGFGNGFFMPNKKITDSKDIKVLTNYLRCDLNYNELVILGFTVVESFDAYMGC